MPSLSFIYAKSDLLAIYSTVSAGALYQSSTILNRLQQLKTYKQMYFAYQIYPVGLRIGRKLRAFTEIGFGHRGLLAVGISYQIPAN